MNAPGLRRLLLQAVLVHAAAAVVRPMISYRALELGAGNAQLGLIATAWGALPLLLAAGSGSTGVFLGMAGLMAAATTTVLRREPLRDEVRPHQVASG